MEASKTKLKNLLKSFSIILGFLILFGAVGYFLMQAFKNADSTTLPLAKVQLTSSQKETTSDTNSSKIAYTTNINAANGIDIRLANATDFGITFPKTLVEPIIIPLPGSRSVEIIDQSADNKKAELISADKISSNQQNSKLLDIIAKDPNLAVYQTSDQRKNIFYAYQGNPSGEGRGKFKNWIFYAEGNGSETESFLIQKAKITLDQNGNAKIYADDATNNTNQNPDFTIPKPYFIDKDGKQTNLDWELDENANTLTVKITANQNQYPLILDPTIEFDATIFSIKGTFKTYGTVNLGKGKPFYCGDTVQGLSPDTLTYGTVWGADGKCWLDRNLGATQVATSSADSASYGWYYQWGRLTDGHQIGTSGTTGTLATSDTPGHANFITTSASPNDWRNPQNDNLWQGVSGINNPCPTGFRLPTSAEWSTLIAASPAITNSATAFSSALKLPLAGLRWYSSGAFISGGSFGYHWSSSISGTSVSPLVFGSTFAAIQNNNRAGGMSIRCIKDSTAPALFNFTDQTGVNPSTLTNSNILQITGLSAAAAVSISGDGTPEYRICGDSACSSVDHTWSSSAGSIDNNQYLQLRLTSNAAVCPTINSATVMVGDGSNKWSVTTAWSCGCTIQGLSPDTLTYGTVTGADTKCWLDRNLGATQVATSSTDSASYGWLYQWGRLTDGHQISTSGTTTTLATSDIPGHANFITTSSSPYDWRSDNNKNRWATGANNPCPTGFHVPTSAEWTTLKAAAPAITNSATALSSTLKLPLAGYRGYNGSLYSQGSLGRYWSSSVGGVFASSLNFDSSSSSMGATSYLAYGFSVRCVKN